MRDLKAILLQKDKHPAGGTHMAANAVRSSANEAEAEVQEGLGELAYEQGKGISDNPWPKHRNASKHEAWEKGYRKACVSAMPPPSITPVKPEPNEAEVASASKQALWKADLARLARSIVGNDGKLEVKSAVWEELWEMAWSSGDLGNTEEGQRIINAVFAIHRSCRCATPEMVKLTLELLVRSM